MDSSACAIRSEVSRSEVAAGRFAAVAGDLRRVALEAAREAVFFAVFLAVLLGFFDIFGLPDHAPLTGLQGACKRAESGPNEGVGSVAIGTAAAIVRANLPGPA